MLKGKTAIVTGASRGIGKAIAVRFLKEGAYVFPISRTSLDFNNLGIATIACDVSQEEQVKSAVNLIGQYGKIDILINTAGIAGTFGMLSSSNFLDWKNVFEVNVFGTFLMMKYVLPQMRNSQQGKIINFSGGGDGPLPGFSAYSASKAAVVRLTETAAKEVKEFGIDINTIAPGPVKTKLFDKMFSQSNKTRPATVDVQKAVELTLFLASEKSNGLTGKFLSAVWDNWQKIPENFDLIMGDPNVFTLRRVRGEL